MTGSARPTVAYMSAVLVLVCVVAAFIVGRANGLLVLASLAAVAFWWAIGGFTRGFWVPDVATSQRLTGVDAEIDEKSR